jgi:hypothetical protein
VVGSYTVGSGKDKTQLGLYSTTTNSGDEVDLQNAANPNSRVLNSQESRFGLDAHELELYNGHLAST